MTNSGFTPYINSDTTEKDILPNEDEARGIIGTACHTG
jgi:hypothetical protein